MIKVIQPGIWTTIQDIGRYGYRNQGVPVSGAMDTYSFILANQLLGNSQYAPVFEVLMQGPRLKFTQKTYIAITGASFDVLLNGAPIALNTRIKVPTDSILEFKRCTQGMYAYLSVQGGFNTEEKLGSASFYKAITQKAKIEKGDAFAYEVVDQVKKNYSGVSVDTSFWNEKRIKVNHGPEWALLDPKIQSKILNAEFEIDSSSNRMSINLKNQIECPAEEIITSPVMPGTVQMTPSGNISVLMKDAQTTGGYARIFQLSEKSINVIAQKRPGEAIVFDVD